MQELLAQEAPPDAVLVSNNRMTAGALEVIEEAKLAIPEQIAVIGYDEISWAPLLRTALTTLSQPAYDLGHEGARLLLSRLNGYSGSPRTVLLPTYLNIRASSTPKQCAARSPALEPAHPQRRQLRDSRKRLADGEPGRTRRPAPGG
jgi:LacI family transcriptional regulator